jgi:hypothetical protein
MSSIGWEALGQWGEDVARIIEPLAGGVANDVWSVRVQGRVGGDRSPPEISVAPRTETTDREANAVTMPCDGYPIAVATRCRA